MARKGENIYKRKDGRYEGRYIKQYGIDGKPQWGYVYGKTYAETKGKLNIKKVEKATPKARISSEITIYEWVEKWIYTQRQIKLSTRMMYFSFLENHIKRSIGTIALGKISSEALQTFIDNETEKYSAKTIHSVFSMLRLALSAANEKGYVGSICNNIKLPKVRKSQLRVLSQQEQKQLEKIICEQNNRYDIGILICLYTGIRIGELCALKWENIDLKNGTIFIDKTVQRVRNEDVKNKAKTSVIFSTPKSSSSIRMIPIPSFLILLLRKYELTHGFVLHNDGRFVDTRNVSRRFKKLLELAELPNLKYHILRHTFATRALELGFDAKTLSEILGHSSVTITLNLYAHSLPEHKKKEMNKFNHLFENPSN